MYATLVIFASGLVTSWASDKHVEVKDLNDPDAFKKIMADNKQVMFCIFKPDCPECKDIVSWFQDACDKYKDVVCVQTSKPETYFPKYMLIKFDTYPVLVSYADGKEKKFMDIQAQADIATIFDNLIGADKKD